MTTASNVLTDAAAKGGNSTRYAAYVLFILMIAYMLSFMDRVLISLMIAPISKDLGLGDTQIGLLVGFGFVLLYSIMGIPFGAMADRSNRRNLMVFGILGWSAATAVSGFAGGFITLLAARALVGIGEATLSPAAYSTIADRFERKNIGMAVSVYSMGVSLGGGLAMLCGGYLVAWAMKTHVALPGFDLTGWRLAFAAVGLLGLPLAALMLLTIREARRKQAASEAPPLSAIFQLIKSRKKAFGGVIIGYSVMVIASFIPTLWAPAHFGRAYGLEPAQIGLAFGIIIGVFGTFGLLLGGFLSDRLARRGRHDAPVIISMVSGITQMPFMIGAFLVDSLPLALVLVAIGMVCCCMFGGLQAGTLQLLTPANMRGRMSAIYLLVANIAGMGIGPLVIGFCSEHVFSGPTSLGQALALITGVAITLSLVILMTTRGAICEAIAENEAQEHAKAA